MFEVKVTVDLGEKTLALLTGGIAIANNAKVESKVLPCEAPNPEEVKPDEEKAGPPAKEPEKRTRRTKEQIAADEAKTANGWDGMDDDARLEAIKTEVTKHTKKGKSADIKFLLANFDAGRASELRSNDYDAFYECIARYGKGESVSQIFPDNLN